MQDNNELREVSTTFAPQPIGPYSQGMIANGLLFVSGQIPIDAETGQLVQGGLKDRTNKILENILEIAKSVGCDLQDVVKIKIFLTDIENFELVNEVYSSYFQEHLPARTVVQVAALPRNADIEMEAVILATRV